MLVVILVYQQVENNLLWPTIYGKAVNISPFFVILGVTLFGALLGVLGALVAVPVTASLQSRPAGGHEGAARADRRDPRRGRSARRGRGAAHRAAAS